MAKNIAQIRPIPLAGRKRGSVLRVGGALVPAFDTLVSELCSTVKLARTELVTYAERRAFLSELAEATYRLLIDLEDSARDERGLYSASAELIFAAAGCSLAAGIALHRAKPEDAQIAPILTREMVTAACRLKKILSSSLAIPVVGSGFPPLSDVGAHARLAKQILTPIVHALRDADPWEIAFHISGHPVFYRLLGLKWRTDVYEDGYPEGPTTIARKWERAIKDELDYIDANEPEAKCSRVAQLLVCRLMRLHGIREPSRFFKAEEVRKRRARKKTGTRPT